MFLLYKSVYLLCSNTQKTSAMTKLRLRDIARILLIIVVVANPTVVGVVFLILTFYSEIRELVIELLPTK